jgi:peptidoglycan/LPS O-acetylase OafA/YrhL
MTAAQPKPAERPHLDYVDGFRAVCALWVVVAHGGGEVAPLSPIGKIFFSFLSYSHFGVTTFIVISGFCLGIPVVRNRGKLKNGVLHFFKKRARRILMPYYFAMLLSLVLIWTVIGKPGGTHWDVALPVSKRSILAHLLLVHNFYSPVTINHAFWSIAVEWQIYFFFPLLVYAFARYGPGPTLVFAFFLTGVIQIFMTFRTSLWAVPVHYLALFASGMFAAMIGFGPAALSFWPKLSVWISLVCGGLLLLLLSFTKIFFHDHYLPVLDVLAGTAAAALLAALATGGLGLIRRFLEFAPLVWIGVFSYSVYLIHAPLEAACARYFIKPFGLSPGVQWTLMIFLVEPAIVLFAFLFFQLCERPFMTPALRKNVDHLAERISS